MNNSHSLLRAIAGNGASVKNIEDALRNGADIHARDEQGHTALHYAVYVDGDRIDLVQILINSGIDIFARDNMGRTALMQAVLGGKLECVKALIASGADVNDVSNQGGSALHAVRSTKINGKLIKKTNAEEMIKILIEAGGDIHHKDDDGDTPLQNVLRVHKELSEAWEYDCDTATHLILRGGDINQINDQGNTPILQYYEDSLNDFMDTKILDCMIKNGADINIRNTINGASLLDHAEQHDIYDENICEFIRKAAEKQNRKA